MTQAVVACKIPNGVILEMGEKRVHIKGPNHPEAIVEGGFGLTAGVNKEFMDAWLEKNKALEFVKAGFLFVHEKEANAKAEAKEKVKEKTKMEPLDPLPEGTSNDKANLLRAVEKE